MRDKLKTIFVVLLFSIIFLIVVKPVDAQATSYFCAEKTLDGAWCQHVFENEINKNYHWAQTSCDQTSYCKTGTCVHPLEGSCRPNVAQRVCEAEGGIWDEKPREEIDRCRLGCCYIGDGASFVTQAKCSSQSAKYGVPIENFNPSIRDPLTCIASASPKAKGACTSFDGYITDCRMTTNEECQGISANSLADIQVRFHQDTLCTAIHLETMCVPTERTILIEGMDEVFFVDNCGNPANIYDASKINPVVQGYWDYMIDKKDSCTLSYDLKNVDVCGNCEVFEGSIGKRYDKNNLQMFPKPPKYGDFMCADLSCKSGQFAEEFKTRFGRFPEAGETWCSNTAFQIKYENNPGAEYFRFICSYGEVIPEPGDPFRQTICIESEIPIEGHAEGFKVANWRVNLWEDCFTIDNQLDCEDIQLRDCVWVEGRSNTLGLVHVDEKEKPLFVNSEGQLVPKKEITQQDLLEKKGFGAACVPKYSPALWFWEPNTTKQQISHQSAGDLCMIASDRCIVKFEKGLVFGSANCVENCHCLEDDWAETKNQMCVAMGDCGVIENYVGKKGNIKLKDLVQRIKGEWA